MDDVASESDHQGRAVGRAQLRVVVAAVAVLVTAMMVVERSAVVLEHPMASTANSVDQ